MEGLLVVHLGVDPVPVHEAEQTLGLPIALMRGDTEALEPRLRLAEPHGNLTGFEGIRRAHIGVGAPDARDARKPSVMRHARRLALGEVVGSVGIDLAFVSADLRAAGIQDRESATGAWHPRRFLLTKIFS